MQIDTEPAERPAPALPHDARPTGLIAPLPDFSAAVDGCRHVADAVMPCTPVAGSSARTA